MQKFIWVLNFSLCFVWFVFSLVCLSALGSQNKLVFLVYLNLIFRFGGKLYGVTFFVRVVWCLTRLSNLKRPKRSLFCFMFSWLHRTQSIIAFDGDTKQRKVHHLNRTYYCTLGYALGCIHQLCFLLYLWRQLIK